MSTVPPRALTIAGSDSGGGAGVQADLKTFLGCLVHGMSAITAVTVQNSLGVSGVHELPPQTVAAQIESVVTDIGIGAAKTGMLANAGIIAAVADTVRRLGIDALVVDPVSVSKHGDPLLCPDAVDALLRLLFPLATLVTPNLNEVALLTGITVSTRGEQMQAAKALHALGPRWVLVKGGHLPPEEPAVDLLWGGDGVIELSCPRIDARHTHGTGDTLAAATTAALARGMDLPDAVRFGKAYVTAGIKDSYPLGASIGPVGHFWRVGGLDAIGATQVFVAHSRAEVDLV